jgi:hypothetical protein
MKRNTNVLLDCGFIMEVDSSLVETALIDDPLVLEQDALAKQVDNLALHLAIEQCRDAATHQFDPLTASAALRSTSNQEEQEILQRLGKIWQAWQKVLSLATPTFRTMIKKSHLNCELEQELLRDLASVDFQVTTASAAQLSDCLFQSLGSSLACELGFRVWEGTERRGFFCSAMVLINHG